MNQEEIMTWIKGHLGICLCLILIAVACLLWIVRESSNRYILVKGDKWIYRTDTRTGETVMIRGNSLCPVVDFQPEVSKPYTPPRELSADELTKITGTGCVGTGYFSDTFSGTIYNGLSNISLRSMKVAVWHKDNDGKRFKREYLCELGNAEPLKTSSFSFKIFRGAEGSGYSHSWCIVGAAGVQHTK